MPRRHRLFPGCVRLNTSHGLTCWGPQHPRIKRGWVGEGRVKHRPEQLTTQRDSNPDRDGIEPPYTGPDAPRVLCFTLRSPFRASSPRTVAPRARLERASPDFVPLLGLRPATYHSSTSAFLSRRLRGAWGRFPVVIDASGCASVFVAGGTNGRIGAGPSSPNRKAAPHGTAFCEYTGALSAGDRTGQLTRSGKNFPWGPCPSGKPELSANSRNFGIAYRRRFRFLCGPRLVNAPANDGLQGAKC